MHGRRAKSMKFEHFTARPIHKRRSVNFHIILLTGVDKLGGFTCIFSRLSCILSNENREINYIKLHLKWQIRNCPSPQNLS